MKYMFLFMGFILWTVAAQAQTANSYYTNQAENQPLRGFMRSYGDQKEARNVMIVEAVARYKLGDEELQKEFEKLERNKEYHQKLDKIMKNLSNKKYQDRKNKEAMKILQEAGNKLYNLLAD